MKKNVIFKTGLCLFALCSCANGRQLMTMEQFYDYPIGMTSDELIGKAGQPYDTKTIDDGQVEYEYIERIMIGNRFAETRHYFFILKDNKLQSKRIEESTRPPRIPDSYQMQTTENELPAIEENKYLQ